MFLIVHIISYLVTEAVNEEEYFCIFLCFVVEIIAEKRGIVICNHLLDLLTDAGTPRIRNPKLCLITSLIILMS